MRGKKSVRLRLGDERGGGGRGEGTTTTQQATVCCQEWDSGVKKNARNACTFGLNQRDPADGPRPAEPKNSECRSASRPIPGEPDHLQPQYGCLCDQLRLKAWTRTEKKREGKGRPGHTALVHHAETKPSSWVRPFKDRNVKSSGLKLGVRAVLTQRVNHTWKNSQRSRHVRLTSTPEEVTRATFSH